MDAERVTGLDDNRHDRVGDDALLGLHGLHRCPVLRDEPGVDQERQVGVQGEIDDVSRLARNDVLGLSRGGTKGVRERDASAGRGVREGRLQSGVGVRDDGIAHDVHGLGGGGLGVRDQQSNRQQSGGDSGDSLQIGFFHRAVL